MSELTFNVVPGAVSKPSRARPYAPQNTPSARSQPPEQTRSATESLHPIQFGKHRATKNKRDAASPAYSNAVKAGSSLSAAGHHAAPGKHAAPTFGKHGVNVNQGDSDYRGSHAKGRHATNYNPQSDIAGSVGGGKRKPYIAKHSETGQAQRLRASKQQQRNMRVRKTTKVARKIAVLADRLPKGKSIRETLSGIQAKI